MREFLLLIGIIGRAEEQQPYDDLFFQLERARQLYEPILTLNLILRIVEIYNFPATINFFDKNNNLIEQDFIDFVQNREIPLETPFVELLNSMCNEGISLTLEQTPNEPQHLGIVHTIVFQGRY